MLDFTPQGLEIIRAKTSRDVVGAARLAAERAFPAFAASRLGWAAFVEPSIDMIEYGFLMAYADLKPGTRSWESGHLLIIVDGDNDVKFALSLVDIGRDADGDVYCITARMPHEGGLGYVDVQEEGPEVQP